MLLPQWERGRYPRPPVHFELSDFGFEMQDSSILKFSDFWVHNSL
jgi:hypothetical protein